MGRMRDGLLGQIPILGAAIRVLGTLEDEAQKEASDERSQKIQIDLLRQTVNEIDDHVDALKAQGRTLQQNDTTIVDWCRALQKDLSGLMTVLYINSGLLFVILAYLFFSNRTGCSHS